ncbi:MAG: undecaprenyl-diphosphate phosphatase [Nitriliruptoraceae bacterium]
MPSWLHALVLGIVQGLTEFIPVSSSGHLVLVPAWFGWARPGLAFDVALHVGTLVALLAFYRRDLLVMARAVVSRSAAPDARAARRLVGLLAVASVPVAIAGGLLRSRVEVAFTSPRLAAMLLFVTAALLVIAEVARARRVRRSPAGEVDVADPDADVGDPAGTTVARMGWRHAVTIGVGQAVAILPGISRSGTTITAGIAAGLTRPAAARFAFLLGIPAIGGATVVSLPDLARLQGVGPVDLMVGMAAAAVSGYLAIHLLVRLVSRAGLHALVAYLVLVGAASLWRFG